MVNFIHSSGQYEITIPKTWRFQKTKQDNLGIFSDFKCPKFYKFQIEIKSFTCNLHKEKELRLFEIRSGKKMDNAGFFSFPDKRAESFITKKWTRIIDDRYVNFNLIISKFDSMGNSEIINQLTDQAKYIMRSFNFIEATKRDFKVEQLKFESFMNATNLTKKLAKEALLKESYIETICLLSNILDAYLRLCIMLKTQIIDQTTKIDIYFLYEEFGLKHLTNKDIYNKLVELEIIGQDDSIPFVRLGNERHNIFYRFIPNRFNVQFYKHVIRNYNVELLFVSNILNKLKAEQIEKNVGMAKLKRDFDVNWELYRFIETNVEIEEKENAPFDPDNAFFIALHDFNMDEFEDFNH